MRKKIEIIQKTLDKKDYSLAYYIQDNGAGDKYLLFFNGMFHGYRSWRNQSKAGYLKKNYNFLFIDYQGAGESTKSVCGCFHTLLDDARDVLDVEGIRSVNLVGYSMGGMLAVAFAAYFPDYVKKLILINSAAGLTEEAHSMFRRVMGQLEEDISLEDIFRDVYPLFFSSLYLEKFTGIEDQVLVEYVRYNKNRPGLARLIKDIRIKPDIEVLARKLTMPVLMIIGGDDRIFDPVLQETLGAAIPECVVHTIPGGSHSVFVEEYRRVNVFFEEFLKV